MLVVEMLKGFTYLKEVQLVHPSSNVMERSHGVSNRWGTHTYTHQNMHTIVYFIITPKLAYLPIHTH